MARIARVVAPGYPHHIIQQGNRRMDVFFSDADYLTYITLLKKASLRYGVDIWAYCLMTNHEHFIAVPEKADSLARCFSDAHVRYTRMINKRQEWKGHLWQARFGSNVLDENYLPNMNHPKLSKVLKKLGSSPMLQGLPGLRR